MTMWKHENGRRPPGRSPLWRSVEQPIASWQPFARRPGNHKRVSRRRSNAMLQGLLTRQTQVTTHQDREAQRFLSLLDKTNDVGQHLAVKTLRIHLLGEFVLLANEMPISGLDVPRLRSLLAYLALHRGVPQSRSRIAYALWPDSTDAQAHTNLRNLLFKLRLSLPEIESFLLVERQALCWQPDALWSLDVMDYEGALARAEEARCIQDV